MKNTLKIIILLFVVFMTSGCSGNYNLIINKDLSINEELELTLNDASLYNKTLEIFENNNINKEKYDVTVADNEVKISYNDKYTSIEDYLLNSKAYHQLFNKIEYNKVDDFIDLYIDENIKINNIHTNNNGTNLTDFDFIQLNITNPFKMNFTNAQIVNDDIYTWTIRNDLKNTKLQMQFKTKLDVFPYKGIIVGSVIVICMIIFIVSGISRTKKRQKL